MTFQVTIGIWGNFPTGGPNCNVLSHLLPITVGFFSFLFLCFFSFSFLDLFSSASVLLFFLYSSISFSLPPVTSFSLKNLLYLKHLASWREPIQLRKLLTKERLDRREAWSVIGGSLPQTLWFLFLLYFFSLLKKVEVWKLRFFWLMDLK